MKIISENEIKKLKKGKHGGKPKSQEFYNALKSLKVGEKLFVSRSDWERWEYLTPSLTKWWYMTKNQIRKGHKSQLSELSLKIEGYEEGWVITKIS